MDKMFAINGAGFVAIACCVIASAILLWYLFAEPSFGYATQLWLFVGLGVLPIGGAVAGNVEGMHATKQVQFCGSCHVMTAHTGDAFDPRSQSLAGRHSRNAMFGGESCYTCHADYGLFGAVFTKINGLHHVYAYLNEYRTKTLEETLPELALYKPMPNSNCIQCHTTTTRVWRDVADHAAALPDVRSGKVSCASEGCHGFAHPFTKAAREKKKLAAPHAADVLPDTETSL